MNELDKKNLYSLIQFRIRRILMICSNYDAFIMEEDGRIESQIRLRSKLKASFCPAIAKGVPDEVMQASVNDAKQNLIPRIPELIGAIDW